MFQLERNYLYKTMSSLLFDFPLLSYVVSDNLKVDFVLLTVEKLIDEHKISLGIYLKRASLE